MPPTYNGLRQRVCRVNTFETVLDSLGKISTLVWCAPEGNVGYPCIDEMFIQEFDVLFVGESTCPQAFACPSASLVRQGSVYGNGVNWFLLCLC